MPHVISLARSYTPYLKQTLFIWTGAPGSPQRTWAENEGAKPPPKFLCSTQDDSFGCPLTESIRKNRFRPRYALANLGHPSR